MKDSNRNWTHVLLKESLARGGESRKELNASLKLKRKAEVIRNDGRQQFSNLERINQFEKTRQKTMKRNAGEETKKMECEKRPTAYWNEICGMNDVRTVQRLQHKNGESLNRGKSWFGVVGENDIEWHWKTESAQLTGLEAKKECGEKQQNASSNGIWT